jgi:hypothetical protein
MSTELHPRGRNEKGETEADREGPASNHAEKAAANAAK